MREKRPLCSVFNACRLKNSKIYVLWGEKKTLKSSRFNINKDIVQYELQKRIPLFMYKQMKFLLYVALKKKILKFVIKIWFCGRSATTDFILVIPIVHIIHFI